MNKTFRIIIVIVGVLLIAGAVYFSSQPKNDEKMVNSVDTTNWKTYTNEEVGISFQYPAYFGDVKIEKGDRTVCPEMKTYARGGVLLSHDYLLTFSEKPKVGNGGSYMGAYIRIARTENNTDYCGLDLLDLEKNNPIYESSAFAHPNATKAYVSTVDTTIGTSVSQFYTLFFRKRNQMTVVQPIITFFPYAYTEEAKEISRNETRDNPYQSSVDFVLKNKKGHEVRSYLNDYEKMVLGIKMNDENLIPPSLPNTSGWNTYTNTQYGFEFKYPKGYESFKTSTWKKEALFQEMAYGVEKFEMRSGEQTWQSTYPSLSVSVFSMADYKFRDAPGGTVYTYDKTQNKCVNSSGTIINGSVDPVTINDNIVACTVGTGDAGHSYAGYAMIDYKNNRIVEIGFSSSETEGAPLDKDAILKSFKFTN